jgi:sigma-B regulation protein RsbU (phosphoserine phosphatase)
MSDLHRTEAGAGGGSGRGPASPAEVQHADEQRLAEDEKLWFTKFSLDHAADPSFWIGQDGRYLYVNDAACRSLGYTREELLEKSVFDIDVDLDGESWPEHWQRIRQSGSMTFEARHRRKGGRVFPVEVTVTHLEYRGREYHCTFTRDISDRKQTQEALQKSRNYLQAVIDGIADPILVIGRDYRIVLANRVVREHAGGVDPVAQKLTCHLISHGRDNPCTATEEVCPLDQVIATGRPVTVYHTHFDSRGRSREFEITGWPIFDEGGQVAEMIEYCRDVTERRKAERRVAHLNAVLRAARLVDQLIRRERDPAELLGSACECLVTTGGYDNAWIVTLDDSGVVKEIAHAGMEREFLPMVEYLRQGHPPECIREVLTQPRVVLMDDPGADCPDCPLSQAYCRNRAMCVRLECENRIYGVFVVAVAKDIVADAGEEDLFSEVAANVAFALREIEMAEQRRRMEAELRQARQREADIGFKIQQMLLLGQAPADIPGLRIATITIPSEHVDGDFYDFFRHGDRCLDLVIGDVMGKGIPAALLGAATKSHLQRAITSLVAIRPPLDMPQPSEIVWRLHVDITRQLMALESFVSLCYARVDLKSLRLDFVDCGHTHTIHFRPRTNECRMLHGTNLFLGVVEDCEYVQESAQLELGDVLVFYSDGIIETQNAGGEFFGTERLVELVRRHGRSAPARLIDAVVTRVVEFTSSESFADDLTCVVVQVAEAADAPLGRLDLRVTSSVSELGRVREFVRSACGRCPRSEVDEGSATRLELAVNEAASNVMEHAYHGRGDQMIQLEAAVFEDRVVIRLRHWGEGLFPGEAGPGRLDFSRDSGFGLYIIHHAVDDVSYSRDETGQSLICLTKKFNQDANGRESDDDHG